MSLNARTFFLSVLLVKPRLKVLRLLHRTFFFFHHALDRNCLFFPLAGIEVPAGKPVTCVPGEGMYLHVSQVLLDLNQSSSF